MGCQTAKDYCFSLFRNLVQGLASPLNPNHWPWEGDIAEGRSRLSGFHVLCDEVMFIILSLSLSI